MSEIKQLLSALLWEIYGRIPSNISKKHHKNQQVRMHPKLYELRLLQKLDVQTLNDVCEILNVEIRLVSKYLERVLISRDKNRTYQTILYGFLDVFVSSRLGESSREMRFNLSPSPGAAKGRSDYGRPVITDETNSSSDFNQWLHAMKMVARLPGGMPPEFRRKLWLALADKYLKAKNVDWEKEEVKCFSEQWREDDEELGIQIVKDLHRTGSSLCSGPAGTINQAKLKRILLGYARYNPEVGYCQGFNMLGALILQVMDKEEIESIKVMIYLVEGILPSGYFSGSLGGLQADMAVFRELMTSKLPRLAKHLQKLQGPVENAFEPPLTNVFTMQWFLTMFCTCLPMTCVLRVWDLVLIEGSDVLLRTALVLWSLLEERILNTRTADDFYCKMGSFSSELLNGHLIDSNGLVEKVVDLGPILELQKLRDKHLYNISPFRDKSGLQLYYSDDEGEDSDDDSRMAVATAWGLRLSRRGSAGLTNKTDNKDRIALDISLLKKQYDRLRERQRQAHIILTSAVARQGSNANQSSIQMNQLLVGRNAIVTNNGRRLGPPQGAIPPARKPSLPTASSPKPAPTKSLKRGETLHWRDTDLSKRRRGSLKWKDIKSDSSQSGQDDRTPQLIESAPSSRSSSSEPKSHRASLKSRQRSDSSSYSEESDGNSSTSTSLCDEDDHEVADINGASLEGSPMKKPKSNKKHSGVPHKKCLEDVLNSNDDQRTVDNQIPFIQLTTMDSPVLNTNATDIDCLEYAKEDSETESNRLDYAGFVDEHSWPDINEDVSSATLEGESTIEGTTNDGDFLSLTNAITSTSLLSPIPDIPAYISNSSISPLCTPISVFDYANLVTSIDDPKKFDVNDEGVTNEYFERINIVERPTKLDLLYSLNEEDSIRNAYKSGQPSPEQEGHNHDSLIDLPKSLNPSTEDLDRKMKVLLEYSNQSSLSFIAEAKHEISSGKFKEKPIESRPSNSESVVSFNNACFGDKNSVDKTLEHTYCVANKTTFLNTETDTSVQKEHVGAKTLGLESPDTKDTIAEVVSNREEPEAANSDDSLKKYALSATIEAENERQREDGFQKSNLVAEKGSVNSESHVFGNDVCRIPTTEDLETRFKVLELSFTDRKKPLNKTIKPHEEEKPLSETILDSKQGFQEIKNSDCLQLCTPVLSSIKNIADTPSNETASAPKPEATGEKSLTLEAHYLVKRHQVGVVHLSPIYTDTEKKSALEEHKDIDAFSHTQISDDLEMKSVVFDQQDDQENQRYESENSFDLATKSDMQTHSMMFLPSNDKTVKQHSNYFLSSPSKESLNAGSGTSKQCLQTSCYEEGLMLYTSDSSQDDFHLTKEDDKHFRDLKSNLLSSDHTQETSIAQTLTEVLVVSTSLVSNKEEGAVASDPKQQFDPLSTSTLNTEDKSVDKELEQNVVAVNAGVNREVDTTRELGEDILKPSLQAKLVPSISPIDKSKSKLAGTKTFADEPVDFRLSSDDVGKSLGASKECITRQKTSVESVLPTCTNTQMLHAEHFGATEESNSIVKIRPKKTGIPSTEELETRFTALERQFSDKAIVVPKETLKDSFETVPALVQDDTSPIKLTDAVKTNKSAIDKTNSNVTTSKTIPSALDLEHRFREFERKLSTTSLIPLSESKTPQEEVKSKCIAKNPSILLPDNEDIKAIKPDELPSTTSTTSETHADITGNEPNFLRKRIPSTEDLESRFDALERQKALKSPTAAHSSLLSPSTPTMVCASNGIKTFVPSTQNLENRFQALEEKKLLKKTSNEKVLQHEEIVLLTKLSENTDHDKAKNNAKSKIQIEEELMQEPQQSQHSNQDRLEEYQSSVVPKDCESLLFLQTIKDQSHSKQRGNKFVPSTKDLESRFDALEKRKSFTELNSNSKESLYKTPQDLTNEQGPRTIPSTEALESRFEALEQRKSVSDDFTPINQSCAETLDDFGNKKKIDLKKIPSTKDLETRFDALEQRKSFTDDSYVPKAEHSHAPNDCVNEREKVIKKVPSTKDLENRFETLEYSKSNNDEIQCTPKTDEIGLETLKTEVNSNKMNNKRIPSTKDLETRFKALEQQKSISDDHFGNKKEESTFEPTDDVIEKKKISIKSIPTTKDLEIRFDALGHGKVTTDNRVVNKDNETISMTPKESVTEKQCSNENLPFEKDSNTQADVQENEKPVSDQNYIGSESPKDANNAKQLNNKKSPSRENSEFDFEAKENGSNDTSNIFPNSVVPDETIFEKLDKEKTRKEVLSSYNSKTPSSETEQKSPQVPSTQALKSRFEALNTEKSISDNNLAYTTTRDPKEINHKDVPSTKELETRFEAFANQKQTEQRLKTKQDGKERESDSISLETPSMIPSATDLDTRFEALEKQKLALSTNSRYKNVNSKNSSEFFDNSLNQNSPKEKMDLSDTFTQISKLEHVNEAAKKNLTDSEAPPKSGCSYLMKNCDTEKICDHVNPTVDDLNEEAKREVRCPPKIQVLSEKSQIQAHLGDSPQQLKRKDLYKLESQSDGTLAATDQNSHGKTGSRPTSCPEYANPFDSNIVTTDRVLKIIEENSKILHRILKKTLADSCDTDTIGQPRKTGLTDSLLALGSIFPQASESTSPSRIMSHSWVRPSITIRSDDNISDRLASIKSTIKSIDTLCEEKSFRKEKCQRYIDSLFARQTMTAANPSIRIDDFEENASPHKRLAKRDELKKDCSPRRRRDEDREEYESRVRRSMMPNSLEASSELSCSLANIEHVDNEVDMINQRKNTDAQMQRPLSPYYTAGYDLNKRSITPVVYIPTKLEIRHTTVTSTFYDRYLTEKHLERTSPRNKKSPTVSPTMTKSYLDIAKCSPPDINDRSSKSAENSPSRKKTSGSPSTNETVSSTINRRNLISTLEVAQQDLHIRSCDNILLQLRSTTNHNKDIVPSIMMYSPLPAKIRKPTELGISLGLYKDYASDESSKS